MSEGFLFKSSRGQAPATPFAAAVLQGLAPDGGLYVPLQWPRLALESFAAGAALPAVCATLLAPFVEGDPIAAELPAIAREALNFEAPLVAPGGDGAVLVPGLFS